MHPRWRGLAWQAQRSSAWPWEAWQSKRLMTGFVLKTSTKLACVAWRFWLLSNKGGRGQKNREEISRGFVAAPGSTKPPCYTGYHQTCFGRVRVVGVWGRRGSIGFLIFYGSKFNVRWFGCHPRCNELRKYNRVLQLSKMSKNCINAFKKQNSDNT